MRFKVGQKVVCVDAGPTMYGRAVALVLNHVYTVSGIDQRRTRKEIERLRKALREIADGYGDGYGSNHGSRYCRDLALSAITSADSNPTGNIEGGA